MLIIRRSRIGFILAVVLLSVFFVGCIGGPPNTPATYKASGKVVDSDNVGIAEVLLSFTSADTNKDFGVAKTDKDGKWNITGLSGNVSVSPALEGLEFEDAPRIITKEESDLVFVGKQLENLPQTYNSSGKVVDSDGVGIADAELSFTATDTNKNFGVAKTDKNGKWNMPGLSGSVSVNLAKDGWEFAGTPKTITNEESDLVFVGKQLDYMGLELGATWVYEMVVTGTDEDFNEMPFEVTQRVIDVKLVEGRTIYTLEATMAGLEESEVVFVVKDNFGKYYSCEEEGDLYLLFVSPLDRGSEFQGLSVIERKTKDTTLGVLDVWVAEGSEYESIEYTVEFAPYIGIIFQSESDPTDGYEMHMKLLSYTIEGI